MPEGKPRLTRLTAIVTQLQSKQLLTARAIADKHGISIRTVYRDIRTLQQSGIPIVTEEGKGYRIMEGYQLPPVLFSEAEANAIITAEQIVKNNTDESLVDSFSSAVEKIKAVLKELQKEKAELLAQRIQIRKYNESDKTSRYLIQCQEAITAYQLIEIKYHSLQHKTTLRQIEPFALIQTQAHWVLIAYCRLRQAFRVFRLDCIQELSLKETHFESHNMSLEDFFEKSGL